MKYIHLFEDFKGGDRLGIKKLGDKIALAIFPKYEKGTYSEDTSYGYGSIGKFSDGTTENGITMDDYTLKIYGKWLVLDALKFDKNAKSAFMSIVDPNLPHVDNTLDCATISVRTVRGISSDREEIDSIVIWAGDSDRGASAQAVVKFPLANFKSEAAVIEELKKQLDKSAGKVSMTDLVSTIFGNIGGLRMVASKDLKREQVTKSWGLGSGASDNVFHTIHKAYDFSKFVKKYGIDVLKDALNTRVASYFKGRMFRGLSDDGFMTTDESWVDKYD